jgi:peptidoglycan/LPS O-acetylase OafA/YrhL
MRSANRTYYHSVDHIRAFAALLVVFYHGVMLFNGDVLRPGLGLRGPFLYSDNPLKAVLFEGHTAVALFMVLSGFIFTVGTLGHEVSYGKFIANRLLRIYPLFILLTIVGLAMTQNSFTFCGFVQLVGGLGNLPGATGLGWTSTMFWAVAIEMQFYLLFPLLNRLLTRFGLGVFSRLLLAVVVVRGLIWLVSSNHDVQKTLYVNLAGRLDEFLLGMVAAWLFSRYERRFRGWWKVGIALALTVAALWAFNHVQGFVAQRTWRLAWIDVEAGLWAAVILTYVATCRATNFISRAAAKVGEFSFSIYLLHPLVIALIIRRDWWIWLPDRSVVANAFVTTVLVLVPLVLACSAVTYYGVEQPFLRMRMKYLLPAPEATESSEPPRTAETSEASGRLESPPAPRDETVSSRVPAMASPQRDG